MNQITVCMLIIVTNPRKNITYLCEAAFSCSCSFQSHSSHQHFSRSSGELGFSEKPKKRLFFNWPAPNRKQTKLMQIQSLLNKLHSRHLCDLGAITEPVAPDNINCLESKSIYIYKTWTTPQLQYMPHIFSKSFLLWYPVVALLIKNDGVISPHDEVTSINQTSWNPPGLLSDNSSCSLFLRMSSSSQFYSPAGNVRNYNPASSCFSLPINQRTEGKRTTEPFHLTGATMLVQNVLSVVMDGCQRWISFQDAMKILFKLAEPQLCEIYVFKP